MSELFCERMRRLRVSRGLTQQQLSEASGLVGNRAACNWEIGRDMPRTAILPAVARALGVSTDYLLTGREAPKLAALHRAILIDTPRARLLAMVGGSE